jgi:methyl farnesoate epoxidase/farnesoate epoxidase
MEPLLVGAALVVLLIAIFYQMTTKPPHFPPGPPRVPILGSMPFLPKLPTWRLCHYLSQKYGPISGVYLGPFRAIVISDLNIVR